MELLLGLTEFDPNKRLNALEVLNSACMAPLREDNGVMLGNNDLIQSYMAYSLSSQCST